MQIYKKDRQMEGHLQKSEGDREKQKMTEREGVGERGEFEFEFIFILQRLQIRQDASFHLAVNTEL